MPAGDLCCMSSHSFPMFPGNIFTVNGSKLSLKLHVLHAAKETDEAVTNLPIQPFLLVYFSVQKSIELGLI